MSMLSPVSSNSQDPKPVAFAANSECFVSGSSRGVQVWRRGEDSQPIATMEADNVRCVACSKDGKWIAAGTFRGDVVIWDAKIYKQTVKTWSVQDVTRGLEFSPDGTRLIVLGDQTATIWNLATPGRLDRPLHRHNRVWAAKYSPHGDFIATATEEFVRVYHTNDVNNRLQDIPVKIATCQYNTGLVWSHGHFFVLSGGSIKRIDASTGSVVSECPVPDSDKWSCIVMPKNGGFIACSGNQSVTFWDPLMRNQLGVFPHYEDIYSMTLSPDGRFLAIGGDKEKITIKCLSSITEPDFDIEEAVLDLWKRDSLREADEKLSVAICAYQYPRHHVLASRACIRARLGELKEAAQYAEEAIQLQPTVIGYIAKSIALVGMGEKNEAYRACDIAFQHCHSTNISFLLLIKAVIVCMAGEHDDAISRVNDLIPTLHFHTECYTVQAYMHLLHGKSRLKSGEYNGALHSLDTAQSQLRRHTSRVLSLVSMISGWKFDDLEVIIQQCRCEALYAAGLIQQAGESSLRIVDSCNEDIWVPEYVSNWACDFLEQYLSTPETKAPDLPLHTPFLTSWTQLKLRRYSWRDALVGAVNFRAPRFVIYQTICKQLQTLNKTTDASECFHGMMHELGEVANAREQAWILEFKHDLYQELERLGDAASHARRYDEAISEYSAVLSLELAKPPSLFVKRSKAYVAQAQALENESRKQARSAVGALPQLNDASLPHISSLCERALNDANKAIELDPSSPWGYERKHAALHAAGHFKDAIDAFEAMLSKMSQSPHQGVRERVRGYINPKATKDAIRKAVLVAICDSPRILIHTISGRLLDKSKQASLFESLPLYEQLISSTTTRIDEDRIQQEVSHYYRYATFSHTWEDNEPLYDKVISVVVYDLEQSLANNKLRMFCKVAKDAGLHWAWSDTCCINKADHRVLQEALVGMFKWYEGSSVTVVFLRGVHSPSRRGDLMKSRWNTRGWTFQEYHASKVVRFYTEDWTPYLNLDVPNHKECPEIVSEMEEVTGVTKEALVDLRPGSFHIREKLCLASGRQTTFVEDSAYSLLGIFRLSMPIVYGERDHALGQLLSRLLTSSGDTSILAWTGQSGSFNSCIPASIEAFRKMPNSHIPQTIPDQQMELIPTRSLHSRSAQADLSLAMQLHDRLQEFLPPLFSGQRMRISCLTFKLGPLVASRDSLRFRAKAAALGEVELRSTEDLSRYHSLTLIHPWLDYLLDRHPIGMGTADENASQQSFPTHDSPSSISSFDPTQSQSSRTSWNAPLRPIRSQSTGNGTVISPASVTHAERQARALRLKVLLGQPFGALLLTQTRSNVEEYRRVASESLITVRVKELTSEVLTRLINSARTLDVL